jgi:hypothetical protein
MKKIFAVVFMLCLTAYGIFADDSCPLDYLCADGTCAVIRELVGEVYLKPADSSVFIAAKVGDVIEPNTIISTGFYSTAVIGTGSSVITVRPLTRLSFAENLNVNLQTGRIKVDTPAGTTSNSNVQSSYATASVRGTDFEFDTVNIKVNEGVASFHGVSGPAVLVKTGGKSSIGANGKPINSGMGSLLPASPAGGASSGGGKASSSGGGGGGSVPSCCQ